MGKRGKMQLPVLSVLPVRPTSIQVGPFIYAVKWDRESWGVAYDASTYSEADDDTRAIGMSDHRGCVIHMNPANAETILRETLLHEVMHTCQFVANLPNETGATGEEFITRISPLLLDTLRRNPDLYAYISWTD